MGPIAAYLLGTGISALGSAIQNRMNRKAAERAYQKDIALMKYQNEYNSPKEQMQRLKEAGLNPNLVYGSGNVSGNFMTSAPRYQEDAKIFDTSGGKSFSDLITQKKLLEKYQADIENTYQDVKNKQVINDILGVKYQSDSQLLDNLVKKSPEELKLLQGKLQEQELIISNLDKTGKLRDAELITKNYQRALVIAQIAKMKLDIDKSKEILSQLKQGMYKAPWYAQVIKKIADELGFETIEDVEDLFLPK